jgi:hypothetical protein
MKKIIYIHIFVIAIAFSAFSQSIAIQCDNSNSTNACFLTDPTPFESSYFANISDQLRSLFLVGVGAIQFGQLPVMMMLLLSKLVRR